jgi:peptidylprolyl isomerase
VRRRAAAFFFVVSVACSAGLAAVASVAAPVGAATDPLTAVTVSTDTTVKPKVEVDTPFAVKKTANSVVAPGTGEALAAGQTITFDYVLVDGRTGKQIQTSYGRTPASLALDATKTAPQLVTGLTGQMVGSRVMIAIAPKDGLAAKLTAKNVKKTDTLVFVIDVKGVRTPLTRATGDAVAPVAGLPAVALADTGAPTVTIPSGATAPTSLVVQPLIKGTGPAITAAQTLSLNYQVVIWSSGKVLESTWAAGGPTAIQLEASGVISGWKKGLVGQTVGSQVLLVVPPDEGYGAGGSSDGTIKGTDTLVFVIDILDAY